MALNFPDLQPDGATWEDTCGNVWTYNKANNSWSKLIDFTDYGISPWVREGTVIKPRVEGDTLDMPPGVIDLSEYDDVPEVTDPVTIGQVTVTGSLEPALNTAVTYTATHDGNATDVVYTFTTDDTTAVINNNTITFNTQGSYLITATATSATASDSPTEGTLRIVTDPPGATPAPPSDSSANRWCVAVIDEDRGSQGFDSNATQWTNFRANWPGRYHFVLEASREIDSDCAVTRVTSVVETKVDGENSCIRVPDNYKADLSEPYANWMPVKRVGNASAWAKCAEDWYEMIGASRLPDNSRICLFVDNSGSMRTSTVQHSYDLFVSKLEERGISFFVVENGDENWIETFDREF